MKPNTPYETIPLLAQGRPYSIGVGSAAFSDAIFMGTSSLNGKTQLIFNLDGNQLTVNPSFYGFILETEFEDSEGELLTGGTEV